jgi:hypothetical protein
VAVRFDCEVPAQHLDDAEWYDLVERAAKTHLGITLEEFNLRLQAKDWAGLDHVRVARVLNLLPDSSGAR